MNQRGKLTQHLRRAIGTTVEYHGVRCSVVELLEEPLCLVLETVGGRTTIQDNQFGSPQRRVTQVFTLPCLSDSDDGSLHQELLSLGLGFE
jgi:hypothetical protein